MYKITVNWKDGEQAYFQCDNLQMGKAVLRLTGNVRGSTLLDGEAVSDDAIIPLDAIQTLYYKEA